MLLSQMDKAGFAMAYSTINESARRRWEEQGREVIADPIAKCAAECSLLAVGGYIRNVPEEKREPIHIFYDRGEPFQEIDLPFHFGLQAADMVAWAHSRALRQVERPFHYLKEWLLEVVPSQTIEHTEESLRNPDRNKNTLWQRLFDK